MSVAEAMAAGVPVMATRAGDTPELVERERTGLLVTPGRSEELADAERREPDHLGFHVETSVLPL
jgi:glycosyltransferase involved in cell wall biosynthesis